jgi:hypothetical protein
MGNRQNDGHPKVAFGINPDAPITRQGTINR